jgi:SprT-like family
MLTNKQIIANQAAVRFKLQLERYIQENLYKDFTCDIKLDWDFKRRTSRGGIYKNGPGINIAMASAALIMHNPKDVYRFYEYPSYDSNNVIGGFYAKDYLLKLRAIIAHEVAHAVQFFEYKKLNIRCKPHGPVFKKHYSTLRTTFINNDIPNQLILKKDYEDSLKALQITTYS